LQEIVRIDSFVTAVQAQLDAERQRVDGALRHQTARLRLRLLCRVLAAAATR